MNKLFDTIDWDLLRSQKVTLLEAIEHEGMRDQYRAEDLDGITHLIDALQDMAHEQGYPVFMEVPE